MRSLLVMAGVTCGLNNSTVGIKPGSTKLAAALGSSDGAGFAGKGGMRVALTHAVLSALLLVGAQRALATEAVLHSFMGSPDGATPSGGTLLLDKEGNLYGTTLDRGAYGGGTVFEVTPSGTETVLYSFNTNGTDGITPAGVVVMDESGNLYGTTYQGGTYNLGTAFELTPSGTETILWSFGNGTDGSLPGAGPIRDGNGNLYGTTSEGGAYGFGTVWEVTPSGTETVLWSFGNRKDGSEPQASPTLDGEGNLYGTTYYGGVYTCTYGLGCGTVWKVTPSGTETVLYSFNPEKGDGNRSAGAVAIDSEGNIYGTCHAGGALGSGTVFGLTPSGIETILYAFGEGPEGEACLGSA